ncbi:hypothetical protein SPBR_05448 [Sporothrix brasiliensis 5110]|uniref:Uncharacterized protein n=1 Tax=Sporothrix brasiliensis 5110 TaxID=1398154 RepID=A0A0C2IL46_9PEZI|nr:uncharacterized protein SPBR_05448 [Sporothrix brasiliensis 5110]KIH87700.1 hypothetical protein SPBR_05448 [Sporothrix brasiliensis 5110]
MTEGNWTDEVDRSVPELQRRGLYGLDTEKVCKVKVHWMTANTVGTKVGPSSRSRPVEANKPIDNTVAAPVW